ncbi:hypothetical protein M0802_012568 [Mischocyttarus mexicanus]|nr:hypothetical protein M0802_012583 [Mischocyttarus mexicanus]KAI4485721.1 hypothetical protein M0802_012568 [Mischocyttarus mexicanus]
MSNIIDVEIIMETILMVSWSHICLISSARGMYYSIFSVYFCFRLLALGTAISIKYVVFVDFTVSVMSGLLLRMVQSVMMSRYK